MNNVIDINRDINQLVDRVHSAQIYNVPFDLIRKLNSHKVEDLLMKIIATQELLTQGEVNIKIETFLNLIKQLNELAFCEAKSERKLNKMSKRDKQVLQYWIRINVEAAYNEIKGDAK